MYCARPQPIYCRPPQGQRAERPAGRTIECGETAAMTVSSDRPAALSTGCAEQSFSPSSALCESSDPARSLPKSTQESELVNHLIRAAALVLVERPNLYLLGA